MKMRKVFSVLLAAALVFSLTACGDSTGSSKGGTKTSKTTGSVPDGYSTTVITTEENGEISETKTPHTTDSSEVLSTETDTTVSTATSTSTKKQKSTIDYDDFELSGNYTVSTAADGATVYTFEDGRTFTVRDELEIDESESPVYLTIDNINAVMNNWQGFSAVHQGYLFIPDQTELGRTYTPKMIERELSRIDDMDISLLRSYYEPSYAFTGEYNADGSPIYDWDSEFMGYFYSWISALQQRGVDVVINMGWSIPDSATYKTTSMDRTNPFYGMTYSDLMKYYGEWFAESMYQIVNVKGYTNVKYAIFSTEPLYHEYSGKRLTQYAVKADAGVNSGRYVAILDDETYCTTNLKSMYLSDVTTDSGYATRNPDAKFYDWNTGAEIPNATGRITTGWDLLVKYMESADKAMRAKGIRSLISFVGPNVVIPNNYLDVGTSYLDTLQWFIDRADSYIDIYAYHYYPPAWPYVPGSYADGSFFDDNYDINAHFFNEITAYIKERTGKSWWFDESNYHPSQVDGKTVDSNRQDYAELFASNPLNGCQINQTVIAAMNTGVSTYMLWQLFETVWPYRSSSGDEFSGGIHVIGTAPAICESSVPYVMYYDVALLAKYGGSANSTTYCGTGKNGVYLTMVRYEKDGKTYQSILVQNTNVNETKIDIQLAQTLGGVNMYRYVYNPYDIEADSTATITGADVCFKGVEAHFQDAIPAMSLVIYSTEYND